MSSNLEMSFASDRKADSAYDDSLHLARLQPTTAKLESGRRRARSPF